MKKKIAIIGAGLSSAALSFYLKDKAKLYIFDKARGCGGRLSRHECEGYHFDMGAQDLIIQNNYHSDFLEHALHHHVIGPWQPTFQVNHKTNNQKIDLKNTQIMCGIHSMSRLIKYYTAQHKTYFNSHINQITYHNKSYYLTIDNAQDQGPFDMVVITCPAPQVMKLTDKFNEKLKNVRYNSCIMLQLGLSKPLPSSIPDVIKSEQTLLQWVIQPSSKPGNISKPALSLQSKAMHSIALHENKDEMCQTMLKEANQILNTKLEITYLKTHLWRYSKCINPLSVEFLLLDNLAIIGDCMQPIAQLSLLESCIESAAQLSKHILPQQ